MDHVLNEQWHLALGKFSLRTDILPGFLCRAKFEYNEAFSLP